MPRVPLVLIAFAFGLLLQPWCAWAQSNPLPEADTLGNAQSDSADIPRARDIARQPIPDEINLGIVERSIVIVDDAHLEASRRLGSFMGQIDGFFSNAGFDASIKVRAVLPRTERKLKLLISSEDDERQNTGEIQGATSGNSRNASLALRFIRTVRDKGDVNLDIGARGRDGTVQYFGRVRARYSWELGDDWTADVANNYFHYNKSGFENTRVLAVW